eukprot:scaffold255610_cov43-Tisochrysis_lutea.AAC.2
MSASHLRAARATAGYRPTSNRTASLLEIFTPPTTISALSDKTNPIYFAPATGLASWRGLEQTAKERELVQNLPDDFSTGWPSQPSGTPAFNVGAVIGEKPGRGPSLEAISPPKPRR